MSKETEKRLIRTLEFLKEPQGSTIPAIVRAINDDGPQLSLKRIVQTLRGCLESGILKVSDGRFKLKQLHLVSEAKPDVKDKDGLLDHCGRPKSACQKPTCPNNTQKPCPTPSAKPKACKPKEGTTGGKPACNKSGAVPAANPTKSCSKPKSKASSHKGGRRRRRRHEKNQKRSRSHRRRKGRGGGRRGKCKSKSRSRRSKKRFHRKPKGRRCAPKRKIQPYCKKRKCADVPYIE